jgi:hypothetical protein
VELLFEHCLYRRDAIPCDHWRNSIFLRSLCVVTGPPPRFELGVVQRCYGSQREASNSSLVSLPAEEDCDSDTKKDEHTDNGREDDPDLGFLLHNV